MMAGERTDRADFFEQDLALLFEVAAFRSWWAIS